MDRSRALPGGAILEDARAILPETMIFQYREHASFAGFSNFFRYKLLLERGGWWVDTDTVCLRPFDFDAPYVFGSQPTNDGREIPTASPLKAPAGSPAFAHAWEYCQSRCPEELVWGETGPRLVAAVIERFSLGQYRQPRDMFCPLHPREWRRIVDPSCRVAVRSVGPLPCICGTSSGGGNPGTRTSITPRNVSTSNGSGDTSRPPRSTGTPGRFTRRPRIRGSHHETGRRTPPGP